MEKSPIFKEECMEDSKHESPFPTKVIHHSPPCNTGIIPTASPAQDGDTPLPSKDCQPLALDNKALDNKALDNKAPFSMDLDHAHSLDSVEAKGIIQPCISSTSVVQEEQQSICSFSGNVA